MRCLSLIVAGMVGSVPAPVASAPPEDKSEYHLFHPTPRALMRDLSTDRPDATESPYTVDAGHVQVETSFLEYTRDRRSDSWSVAPTNFKVGLTNNLDVQLVFQPYLLESGSGVQARGFGDTQIRIKINLWGNDSGPTAGAVMPFVELPTGRDEVSAGRPQYGLIVPFAFELPGEVGLSLMVEFDAVRNENDDGYRLDLVHTAALGRPIAGPLGGFVEYVGVLPFEDGQDYQASLAGGFTFAVNPDVQLDVAARFGLTDAAEDFAILAGVTVRY